MGLACVDGVGAGLWARKGHKGRSAGRVSRKLFAASDPARNVQRNLQFARQHLEAIASRDFDRTSARFNFDMQTMAPQPGPLSWTTTESAPQFYQPRAYTGSSHNHTSLPHTHTHFPDTYDTSAASACDPVASKDLTAPTTANLVDATSLTLAHTSHTTCLTLPTSPARPLSPNTKPVKRLQQRSTTKVTPRKITDYFTEVRTPRLQDLGKVQPKTDLLDSSAVSVTIRESELRLED